jgi:5'-deoxynucleotidase YfbR-like HD superfamily hydrolase
MTNRAKPMSQINNFVINDGQLIDIFNVADARINLQTIAHSLSNQCRYNGHTDSFYSVAQHCCIAHDSVRDHDEYSIDPLAALLHDAGEAFTGDIVRPVKHMFDGLRDLEHSILRLILKRMNKEHIFDECLSEQMHTIDMRMLATEKRDLFRHNYLDWPVVDQYEPFPEMINTWTPKEAKKQWLIRLIQQP